MAAEGLKGQARRGAETREAILAAATTVFARRGFRGSALAEVAAVVDMTPAGILYHFGSKEALLLAVIQDRDRRAQELGSDMHYNGGLASFRGVVRYAEMSEAEPGLVSLHTVLQIENLEPGDPAYEYFQERTRFALDWFERMLIAAQAAGEVRSDIDPPSKAAEITAFLEGAAVVWLLNPHLSLVELYDNYIAAVIGEIGTA